ncbi:nucleotidyltransferase domain-containing protein [Candidatus Woesebacteria bacterium]|nr:nucleotidyltransferase domain-containing protein [Candidatus Woesebacteria bacterium]
MQLLEQEILLTFCYCAQFSFPLTKNEVFLRRISLNGKVHSRHSVFSAIETLVTAGYLYQSGQFLQLSTEQESFSSRAKKASSSVEKYKELRPLLLLARYIPAIAGIAITGSAAMKNASEDDDIDIMIVTEKNRLWLVRPLVIFFAFLYGKRRTWQKEEKNSWCFNLWLERDSLGQEPSTYSLYVAYEVCQTDWLLSRGACMQQFFTTNSWVRHYLPEYYRAVLEKKPYVTAALAWYVPFLSEFLSFLNYMFYSLQLLYMSSHMTRERVSLSFAFFHPRDTRTMISNNIRDIVYKLRRI